MFCSNCGKELLQEARFCQYCGFAVNGVPNVQTVKIIQEKQPKNKFIAILLLLFLGGAGIHDFYLEYHGKGLAKILILLFLGWIYVGLIINFFWCLLDLIHIINGDYKTLLTEEEQKQKEIDEYNDTHYGKISTYEELQQKRGNIK
jgi:TM2 domain-containing membrane protein YozV